ncbi:PAS domain S-box protein [Cognatishimia sp. F0-27]|nr:ATP-binding protein [Cognatishimia sp. F0-27]MCC1493855.1 PAS domain S-box protein [Cognatishimia sp. F0-27]
MRAKSGLTLLVTAGLLVLAAIAFLAINVDEEITQLGSARSDNVQWSLSQAEVEFLEYARQLDNPTDVVQLTRRFDIFYSRVSTIETAEVFAKLRAHNDAEERIAEIRTFLNESARIIDAGEETILTQSQALKDLASDVRPVIRLLAKSGLEVFSRSSDQQRAEVAQTLTQLAVTLAALIGALFIGVLYLNRLNATLAGRERAQAQTATRMNTVISTSLDAVIVSDERGRILEFNPAAEATFGHHCEDVIGRDIGEIIVPDHLRDAHEAGMERMRRSGERHVVGKGRVQLEGKRASGQTFPVELALQSAKTDDGEIFIAFLRDISKRVENEKALVEARDRALAGEKLKTDFLATMSHEIRTPLNGLLGNLTLLRDTRLSKEQDRYLGYMESSGRLLMSHISDVLDITRYDAGKLDTRSEPVHLSALLEDIIDNQSGMAVENETTLDWGWDGEPMHWIVSDHDRLQHVMMNLVGNAVKFTRRGKVSVTARVDAIDGQNQLRLDVADTGVGIDEDLVDQVFDDFVVGETARNREVGGTGLGLGIAKRFVHALRGTISVQSTPGAGSTFTVTLPVQAATPPALSASVPDLVGTPQALRVLLVEDNEMNRIVARAMIEADGHTVVEAHHGREGAELAESQPFDLIFMDINMPVMDGREATRHIRAQTGPCRNTPIVALTANALASDQTALLEDGMNSILTKPLSRDALRRVLAEYGTEALEEADPMLVNLDHSAETRQTVGEAAFAKLVARFTQEVDDLLAWLGSSEPHDYLEVAARSHKVAGSAAIFGALQLQTTLKELENATRSGDTSAFEHSLRKLPAVWSETKPRLL